MSDEFERPRKISRPCRVARAKPDCEEGLGEGFVGVDERCYRRCDEGEPARTRAPPLPPWLSAELPAPVGLLVLDDECPRRDVPLSQLTGEGPTPVGIARGRGTAAVGAAESKTKSRQRTKLGKRSFFADKTVQVRVELEGGAGEPCRGAGGRRSRGARPASKQNETRTPLARISTSAAMIDPSCRSMCGTGDVKRAESAGEGEEKRGEDEERGERSREPQTTAGGAWMRRRRRCRVVVRCRGG